MSGRPCSSLHPGAYHRQLQTIMYGHLDVKTCEGQQTLANFACHALQKHGTMQRMWRRAARFVHRALWDRLSDPCACRVLRGHRGSVLTLFAAGGLLLSGGRDNIIRVWVRCCREPTHMFATAGVRQ